VKPSALVLAAAAPLFAATLVNQGRSGYSICVASEAPAPERRAAAELQQFVEQMSGARLPVTADCRPARKPYLFVGDSAALRTVLPELNLRSFGGEEYVLKTAGKHLVIAGGLPRGTLYGVYGFLDRLGCRWFTADVSRIPNLPTIAIQSLDIREKPAFEYREPFFTEAFDRDWAARNRTNGNSSRLDASTGGKVEYFPFVHSFYQLVPPGKYFRDHPEYFSLIDGKRRVERGQLCLTNPDVLRIAVAQVREWIREHPSAKILSVSQNDWEGWCECDRCRRVEEEEGGRHSGPVLRFVNAVAGEIAKTDPDKLIDTLAYWYTEDPPAKVRPRPNVRIRLCPIGVCEAHPYERCPRSAYFVRNLKAWSAITDQLYIWHYNTNFSHYLTPFPDFDEFAADIPLYHRNGVVGLFLQGGYAPGGGAENSELRAYVMARLLWNPAVDVHREIEDFLGAVYCEAANPMRSYLDRLQREVRMPPEGAGQHIWIFNLPDFGQPFLREANALLRQALEQAKDPAVRRRVERARLPLEYVELVQSQEYRPQQDTYAPADLAGWQRRFHEFAAKLRTFGIQSIREGRTLEQDETAVDAMRAYAAITLENEAWRLVIVPELGGRIVQMIAKQRGRADLLRKPKPGEGGYPGTGGQMVQAFPDFPLRAWDVVWHAGPLAQGAEVLLEGSCANGVQLSRRIRLDAGWVRTEVTARNSSQEPIDVVLQARADFDPGDIDSARIQFESRAGENVDRLVLTPGEQPNGSETRRNDDVPRGEWTLHRAKGSPVVNWFAAELAERTTVSWTAKGGPRVTFGIWSKKRRLAPGETVRLEADYR
jgi:hypothetical protein